MQRRTILACFGAAATRPAFAQQPGRTYRVGIISFLPSRKLLQIVSLLEGLQSMGFVEGQNLVIDEYSFNLPVDQMADAARRMVEAKADLLICTSGGPSVRGAQAAASTVPIVGIADDMVQEGLVSSLANRSGNTTGISILAVELDGKRQEILSEMLPTARRMAALADIAVLTPPQLDALQRAARLKGVELAVYRLGKQEDAVPALDAAKAAGAEAINVLATPLFQGVRLSLFARATALGLPTMFQWPEAVREGATASYGPGQADTFRQLGRLAGKVLRGAKPAALPVEQPTAFRLVINLKVARALNFEVPPGLLQRADEIVE